METFFFIFCEVEFETELLKLYLEKLTDGTYQSTQSLNENTWNNYQNLHSYVFSMPQQI